MSASTTEIDIDYQRAMTDVAGYFQRQRERARPRPQALDLGAAARLREPPDTLYPMPALDPARR